MRKIIPTLFAAALAACSQVSEDVVPTARAETGASGAPIVVELFQSQGCSSCPPANANVNAIAASRADVLALSYAVTYWDYLGWKDSFAKPAYTERQRAYARRGQSDGVYTPQVVINGSRALVGTRRGQLDQAIRAAGPVQGPKIARDGDAVTIGAGQGGPASVLLVTYDPRERSVPVKAGENTGRTLPHRNIVVDLREIGIWQGKPLRAALPASKAPGLKAAILLQKGAGGPIVGAARL